MTRSSSLVGVRRAVATLAAVPFVVALLVTPAGAAPTGAVGDVVIVDEPGVVRVSIPDPSAKSKTDSVTPGFPKPGVSVNFVGDNSASHCYGNSLPCQFNIHKSSSATITPAGGSSGTLASTGTAFVDVYRTPVVGTFTQADYYNTTSRSSWSGLNPFYCTSVKHQDVWDIDYTAVSWSYGGTPSGSVNYGSGRVGYENVVPGTWYINHNVQHVYLRVSGGVVTQVRYEVHGSFQFGSAFYTTDAYSRVALP
jgi:hypothetical protein